MKRLFKIILTILFIPLFLLLILSLTIKFKFLNADFWTDRYDLTFYQNIIGTMKKSEPEFNFSSGLVKSTIDKNLINIVDYLNGQSTKLLVFIPQELELTISGEDVPLDLLLSRYTNMDEQDILYLNYLGSTGFYLMCTIVVLILLLLIISLLLRKTTAVALFISSVFLFLLSITVEFIKIQWARDLIPRNEGVALISVPLMHEISLFWIFLCLVSTIIGIIILAFLKGEDKQKLVIHS